MGEATQRVPVHVIGGFLGVGKTSTVLALLRALGGERVAVVVNDFGEAEIDPTLVRDVGGLAVAEIQGACVCCTAPDQLAATVLRLLDTVRPERILVEPTGLARTSDVVDTLSRGAVAARVATRGVVVVVDPRRFDADDALHREQLAAADVVVMNRVDLASANEVERMTQVVAGLWPRPRLVQTTFGAVSAEVLGDADAGMLAAIHPDHGHDHAHGHAGPRDGDLGGDPVPSVAGWSAQSRRWTKRFSYAAVQAAFDAATDVERIKGFFDTDLGCWLFERAGGVVSARPSPRRGDSRVDAIAREGGAVGRLLQAIEAAFVASGVVPEGVVEVVLPSGAVRRWQRDGLAALPGAVPDVSAVVPGRVGVAARWSAWMAASGVVGGDVVVVASDGMITPLAPMSAFDGALLVHALDGEALPASHGGPFRLLLPGGGPHGNVKSVLRVVIR
jgi:G3E family GTPase